jgi:hypothetical protein
MHVSRSPAKPDARARRSPLLRTTLLLGLLLLPAAGCASSGDPFADPNRPADAVEIEVVNRNFNQATIWALGSRGRRRLGIVPGKGTETFFLDWPVSGLLQLETQILSQGTCLTEQLETDPGDLLYLEVPLEPRNDPACR